jgi:uncharacterized integral membrane protein
MLLKLYVPWKNSAAYPKCFRHFLQTGLCYGKLEAGVLTFIIPTLLLGHLVFLLAVIQSNPFNYMMRVHKHLFFQKDQFYAPMLVPHP